MMDESQLEKLEKLLVKIDLLSEFGWKDDVRSIVSGVVKPAAGGKFWAVKKICGYNMKSGRLPGTDSLDPDAADEDDLRRLSSQIRRSIAGHVFKILGFDLSKAWVEALTEIVPSTTEIFITKEWQVIVQSVWTSFEAPSGKRKIGHLEAGFFVTSRSFT